MAQQVKELVTAATPDTAVAWVQPWPGNFHMSWAWPKKKKKKKKEDMQTLPPLPSISQVIFTLSDVLISFKQERNLAVCGNKLKCKI